MTKKLLSCFIILIACASGWSTTITKVKVDNIRPYQKLEAASGDSNFYIGRLTYVFKAEAQDSIFLNFSIVKQGTTDAPLIVEKTGDVGIIKQANAGDTLKTAYFRVRIVGDYSGTYVANITAEANMSNMWKYADSLVKMMTNAQKQTLTYAWTTVKKLEYFGSDNMTLSNGTVVVGWRSADGPNGIRFPVTGNSEAFKDWAIYGHGDIATNFPTEVALGCTWDTAIARQVGRAIAQESRAMGVFCNLGPMSDLVVNPRWGRAFETMGEDPYLVGKMASHQIMGVQDEKVIATPKHFTPYYKEDNRASGQRVIISERALRELFCVPFEMDILEGGARAIMTSYNKVRVPGFTTDDPTELQLFCDRAGSNRHLINDILRRDWGFDGVIMTDWLGADGIDEKYAFNTPFDMSMPSGSGFLNAAPNIDAKLPGWAADTLNKKARNITYNKLWAWGGKLIASDAEINTYKPDVICSKDHLNLTLYEARESIVLAKNELVNGSPVLPINKNSTLKLAVVGPYANKIRPGGGGSSFVAFDTIITPLMGITRALAGNDKVTITQDYTTADVAIVVVGVGVEEEGRDRLDMVLPTDVVDQLKLVTDVMAKVKRTIVVYTGGSASVAGSWSSAPGVIIAFYPGRNQGIALAEILFGDVNPSGHLNVTFPNTVNDLPTFNATTNLEMLYPSADTAHGYFYFEKKKMSPLFWFGHGLSYTTFQYSGINIRGSSTVSSGEKFDVVATITNTGSKAGSDVVQLYVKPKTATTGISRREKDLRGFARVSLAAGETKTVTFTLGPRDFSIYDVNVAAKNGQWKVIPGNYDLIVGSTSDPAKLIAGSNECAITTVTVQ